jgi:hypothetical protein
MAPFFRRDSRCCAGSRQVPPLYAFRHAAAHCLQRQMSRHVPPCPSTLLAACHGDAAPMMLAFDTFDA